MKLLNGDELTEYIKERQIHQVRGLRQANKIFPKLAIIFRVADPVINTFKSYAEDIDLDLSLHKVKDSELISTLKNLNLDPLVHGIYLHKYPEITSALLPEKDVNAINENTAFEPAITIAVKWLLAGYNVELRGKRLVVVGKDNALNLLVAQWESQELEVMLKTEPNADFATTLNETDVLVCEPGLINSVALDNSNPNLVVVETSKKSLGLLTTAALMDNVIRAARQAVV